MSTSVAAPADTPVQTIVLGGKRYVVLSEEKYQQLLFQDDGPLAPEEEVALVAVVESRKDEPSEPWEKVKQELGLE